MRDFDDIEFLANEELDDFLTEDDLNYCQSCGKLLPSDMYAADEELCDDCA